MRLSMGGRRWIGATMMILGVAALPVTASADPKKSYTAKAPAEALPGSSQTLRYTLKNDATSPQTIGSANLTVPAGFDATAATADRGTITSGQGDETIKLRNLNLAPTDPPVTIQVTADTPKRACVKEEPAAVDHLSTVVVKQANDFNGTGNNFSASADTSLVTQIACTTGSATAKHECAEGDDCFVRITHSSSPTVQLDALAPGVFDGEAQPGGTLTAKWADNDVLDGTYPSPTPAHACEQQPYQSPVSGVVLFAGDRNKELTLRLSPEVVAGTPDLSLEVCAAVPVGLDDTSPWEFKEGSETTFFIFEGALWTSGLLADCTFFGGAFQDRQPCVQSRSKDSLGNSVIDFAIPKVPADPMYR